MNKFLSLCAVTTGCLLAAHAQDEPANRRDIVQPAMPKILLEQGIQANVDYGYDAPGTTRFQGKDYARSDASALTIQADWHRPLSPKWFLQANVLSANFYLDTVPNLPVPDDIHTLRFLPGMGYRWNDQWTFTAFGGASLYRFTDLRGDDFGGTGGVLSTWIQDRTHLWTFGLLVEPDSDIPVFPIAGLRWAINEHYTLQAGVPKTRLTYEFNEQWAAYTGLNYSGTIFRTSDTMTIPGTGTAYHDALGSYRDLQMGVGLGCKIVLGLQAEIEGGYSVYRELNYKDVDQRMNFKPSPYVRISVKYRF